jgi:hypothetical protein
MLQRRSDNLCLRNILSARRQQQQQGGALTHEQKALVLEMMRESKCLDYTKVVLEGLHSALGQQIEGLELAFGRSNPEMKLLWRLLRV